MTNILFIIFFLTLFLFLIIQIIFYYNSWRLDKQNKSLSAPNYELTRESCNPLFSPAEHHDWENESTFNPAVVLDDEGNTHLFYRAIGRGGVSQIGYGFSKDSSIFTERYPYPIFQVYPDENVIPQTEQIYSHAQYSSGGGWAGCEDPRTVIIDNYVYMTYVAFEGWHSVRVALTSISLSDLKKRFWNWKKPLLISVKDEPNKNWALFPEKINGKFAILHCLSPEILIEYVEDLETLALSPIKSRPPHDDSRNYFGRKNYWDSAVRGIGAPPIKTKLGWLVLYHAMDDNDPNKYKVGVMILDSKDPTQILYRSPHAILSPDEHYENDSKPGVIYASGAIIHNGDLVVYYGGGDKHVCTARTPLKKLLNWLTVHGRVSNV